MIRLRPYFEVIGLFAVWAMVWMMVTLRRRQRYLNHPQPLALTLEEEARRIEAMPADLSAWRKLKICVVHLDPKGNVSVKARKAGVN